MSRRPPGAGGQLPIAQQEGHLVDTYVHLRPTSIIAVRPNGLYPTLQFEEMGDSPWSLNLGCSSIQLKEIADRIYSFLAQKQGKPVAEMTPEEYLTNCG